MTNLALATGAWLAMLAVCEVTVRMLVTVREVGPTVTTYHAYYGKALRRSASILRVTPEFTTRITTNSLGFRGPEPAPLARRPIVFVGDSFTLGYGVSDGQEFPALVGRALRARGPDAERPVVNAGLGNNGNGRAVKFLRTEGPRYDPALVVLQLHQNDLQDNVSERLFELTPAGGLAELPVPPPSRARRLWELLEGMPIVGSGLSHSYLAGLLRQTDWIRHGIHTRPERIAASGHARGDRELPLMIRLLEESLAICERGGWPVLAVAVNMPALPLAALAKLCASRHVPMVVVPRKDERPDLYYRVDGHMNPRGHEFTAGRILDAIDAHRLIARAPATS